MRGFGGLRGMALASVLAWVLAGAATADAAPRPAAVFGDHMVLQRDAPIPVWGTARAGEVVTVALAGHVRRVRAAATGRWHLQLPPLRAGGPHEMSIGAADGPALRLHDILVGDVWLCAGQSNMEWPLARSQDAEAEIRAGDRPAIRQLRPGRRASLRPQPDIQPAAWQVASPATVGGFSAVGWFFARRVQHETGVPIGLVDISWGGSHIETWTRAGAAAADPDLADLVRRMPADDAAHVEQARLQVQAQVRRWQGDLPPGPVDGSATLLDDSAWPRLRAPMIWERQGLAGFDGVLWLRRVIELDATQAAGAATLHLGAIDDCDQTWVNGRAVGRTCGWDLPRHYALPPGTLHAGRNVVAVRVLDSGGDGGPHGPDDAMVLDTASGPVPLHGRWRARVDSALAPDGPRFNDWPALLFNGMVHPLLPLRLRGVLWYQGESNVERAAAYAGAFQRLIVDWRRQWRLPQLPFLYVQLASFLPEANNRLDASPWAELREAQRQALALPATGMAVATDVGDADDIHPRHKRPVGERLAALALRQVYGRDVVASGPTLRGWRRLGRQLELRFDDAAGGLATRPAGAPLLGFVVADTSRRFVPARATIDGSRVRVWSDEVAEPVAVRYGWVDNPAASNLVNGAGLPASPLRTDRWPLRTEGVRLAPPWP